MKLIRKASFWRRVIYFCIPIIIISLFLTNLSSDTIEITGIDFIGQATFPSGTTFQKTAFGGLSGITYDEQNQLYYAISDDRSEKAPARFYTLKIDLSKGVLKQDGVVPVEVKLLLDAKNQNFAPRTVDTEGIALGKPGSVFISSEGDASQIINPFIKEFLLASGKEINNLSIPDKFLPSSDIKKGVRNNLALESLTITPNKQYLFTATENALIQDGTEAKPGVPTSCRILRYNLTTNQADKEYLYVTEAVKPLINITGKYAQGLPDLHAIDNQGHFLSIERAFTGLGFRIALFQVSLENATDISNIDSLQATNTNNIQPVQKKLLLDLRKLDVLLDNIEGLTLGSKLPDGQPSLILVSDNNFQSIQRTQFLAFRLKTASPLQKLLRRLNFNNNP
ncbi:esterase-like activity of phytase family protein [Calothrix sp. UHCC 0171]|uniref:esterase-like activity of phytase family protein n=1 Tax=Calothrix sp. UHCC 0171 TaxID=3110245 RepID=UPI002B21EF95|nr:esterase-like activity of phytase family protein [Calothrix sp. UHCC 0171]MEA5573140.1 esterase-like activity of phytase family protein [Calothrix sp. UHCC 0171]